MAKGPIITEGVEALIGAVYRKHPKWKAPTVRNEVSLILHKLDPKPPEEWPSLSTVQKVLATVRRRMKEAPVDPQDKPWSMATLDQYPQCPIPPEAIPAVLKAWKFCVEANWGFTIRKAKWVARLSGVIADTLELSTTAERYVDAERVYDSVNRPFDSSGLDRTLMHLPFTGSQFYFKSLLARYLSEPGRDTDAEKVKKQLGKLKKELQKEAQ